MGTKILKYAAILALVVASLLELTFNGRLLAGFVICASGIAVAAQAVRANRWIWAGVFTVIAVLFNPVVTVPAAYSASMVTSTICAVAFVLSLFLLENLPKKTIASITGQGSGSDSL